MDPFHFSTLNTTFTPNIPGDNDDIVLDGTHTPPSEQAVFGAPIIDQPMASPPLQEPLAAPFHTAKPMPVDAMLDPSTCQPCQLHGCAALMEGVEDAVQHYKTHLNPVSEALLRSSWNDVKRHVLETWGGDDGVEVWSLGGFLSWASVLTV